MLDGWYCRSIANMQAEEQDAARNAQRNAPSNEEYSSDSSQSEAEQVDYKSQYNVLKKKLKYLIYENECFQDALRSSQKRLLKACRDRSFLLDRLLQYEKPENSSSESDETDSSDDAETSKPDMVKKRRTEPASGSHSNASLLPSASKVQNATQKVRKRPLPQKKIIQNIIQPHQVTNTKSLSLTPDGYMTPEEVERHLQSRHSFLELVSERAPPTVPTEMFSNDPSLDSESDDVVETQLHLGDDWIE